MKFLHNHQPNYDLTFNDVFMVPSLSTIASRSDVDLKTPDGVGTTIPVVVANMNAVAGKRMAETVARRGGIAVLPQDMPVNELTKTIEYVKSRHVLYETPITLAPEDRIQDALNLIHKRSHGTVLIVDKNNVPVGIFTESDAIDKDRFTPLFRAMTTDVVTVPEGMSPSETFKILEKTNIKFAPVTNAQGQLVGAISKKGAVRSALFQPALDADGRLCIGAAIGVNGDVAAKATQALKLGIDVLVVDTAHGHQSKTLEAVKTVRALNPQISIVAGNVVTTQATQDLIEAGADIIKVGIGPGAMCTTRMMTGVGRPQFSAILDCADIARSAGKAVWADGGIRYPRDVALALAAGAASVMIGSWFAGTFESVGDVFTDENGRMYKENYGMASRRAVVSRTSADERFVAAQKSLFDEGISTSRMYIDPSKPGVEDIIDSIVAGVRSSMTYTGAASIDELYDRAVVGVQSSAGFTEGNALDTTWF